MQLRGRIAKLAALNIVKHGCDYCKCSSPSLLCACLLADTFIQADSPPSRKLSRTCTGNSSLTILISPAISAQGRTLVPVCSAVVSLFADGSSNTGKSLVAANGVYGFDIHGIRF